MQRRMSRCRLSSPCRRGESRARSGVSGSANVTKKSFRSSRRLSNQHRSEKEQSSRALKSHPSCSRRRRFVACPRRPLLAIAAADLSIAIGLCASVPTSAHSIRSPPRVAKILAGFFIALSKSIATTTPPWQLLAQAVTEEHAADFPFRSTRITALQKDLRLNSGLWDLALARAA